MTTSELVYLACPYSHTDPEVRETRFLAANRYAAKLMAAGILVFSPISHTHPIALAGDLPKGWDFWERYDRAYLSICRALVVLCLPGWQESTGVIAEIKIMDQLRRPVWYVQNGNGDCLKATIVALKHHCPACGGSGWNPAVSAGAVPCEECGGHGV